MEILFSELEGFFSALALETCELLVSGEFSDGQTYASYGANQMLYQIYLDKVYGTEEGRALRVLESSNYTNAISSPIVCLVPDESIVYAVDSYNYPVYQKDSLLNSNPDFDAGAFLELERLILSTSEITTFVFEFTQIGTYVFSNAGDSNKLMLVVVKEECPETFVMTQTMEYLDEMEVK